MITIHYYDTPGTPASPSVFLAGPTPKQMTPNGAVIKMSPNETWQRNAQKVTP